MTNAPKRESSSPTKGSARVLAFALEPYLAPEPTVLLAQHLDHDLFFEQRRSIEGALARRPVAAGAREYGMGLPRPGTLHGRDAVRECRRGDQQGSRREIPSRCAHDCSPLGRRSVHQPTGDNMSVKPARRASSRAAGSLHGRQCLSACAAPHCRRPRSMPCGRRHAHSNRSNGEGRAARPRNSRPCPR